MLWVPNQHVYQVSLKSETVGFKISVILGDLTRNDPLASVVSKVVERILLDRISHFLETCPNQFGFRRNLGTDTCIHLYIYVLNEMVVKYKSLNGGMSMCFLDASKAFDRVKHSVLFNTLTRRGVPGILLSS